MASQEDPFKKLGETIKAPQKTALAPQKTLAAPQKTAAGPTQKTAAAPQQQSSGSAPQKTALAGPQLKIPSPSDGGPHAPGDVVKVGGKNYTVEKCLGSGTEGHLYIVRDKKARYALKLFHGGYHPNQKVLSALQPLKGKGYVVGVLEYGEDYELMELIPQGSATDAGVKGNAQAILAIAVKVAMILDQMHKLGVLHKDVKPANILIKDKSSWDCVLCDFGIADLLGPDRTCATQQVRTPVYAAPELYLDTVTLEGKTIVELTPKADFYSLGMTILSLWMGEGAFLSNEDRMALDKVKGRITVPPDMPDPLAKICRGLLIRNPAKRWDLEEILLTVKGKDVPVEEREIIEDLNITFNATRHLTANTPEELALCMEQDEDLAIKYLYRGQIEKWLKPYPELVLEIQEIVEKRFPKDQHLGLYAAMYLLRPDMPFYLTGISRETGEDASTAAITLKDVSNFCHQAVLSDDAASLVASDYFREWVRVRNRALADRLPASSKQTSTYLLRIQLIDPLSDINLLNDPSHPLYAMTQEKLGELLNKIYTIYWNQYKGDFKKMVAEWNKEENAPLNRQIPLATIVNIVACFGAPKDFHYITDFFDTKGKRFEQQRSWYLYCTDRNSKDYLSKAGPKDDIYGQQIAWMKVIKGFGVNPVYEFPSSGKKAVTCQEAFARRKSELKAEYERGGLRGWLAVQHHEDPNADLSAQFAYEKRLLDYLEDLRCIDDDLTPVARFDQARKEADRILSEGKGRVRSLSIRSVLQHFFTLVLAILPALALLTILIFSIIENPVIDTSSLEMGKFVWIIGLVFAAIIFFSGDADGCLGPIIGGVLIAGLLMLLVKFLGQFILYFFAVIVLVVLVWFSIKTIFFHSRYAKKARKFTKPGFDEKVLEPLYHAFNSDRTFDSSLNGAFNDADIQGWKDDLKSRRIRMLIFIGSVWVLVAFSLLVPKSERLGKLSKPLLEKVVPVEKIPELLPFESLEPGSRGENVVILQQFLKEAGYLKSKPDGIYGPGTKKAVVAFQKANGLEATGTADKETVNKINQLAAEAERAKTKE